jgi:reactive intermediate/imine deaminase
VHFDLSQTIDEAVTDNRQKIQCTAIFFWEMERRQEMKTGSSRALLAIALAAASVTGLAHDKGDHDQSDKDKDKGKVVLRTDKIYPPIGPYSQMVAYGKLIYFSGFIALNKAGDAIEGATIEEQTKRVLDYIGAGLESQGLSFDDVISSTVYMQDLNEFAAMNRVYAGYFRRDPPARSTIQVARLPRDAKIEIAIIAGRR